MSATNSEANVKKVAEKFSESTTRAEELIKDKEKTRQVLQDAVNKSREVQGPLQKVWQELTLMFGIVADWISGEYREVPTGSIVAIVAALVYFLSPIDAIPDFIPIVGYIDDVFVIGLVVAQVHSDLEKYRLWKDSQ